MYANRSGTISITSLGYHTDDNGRILCYHLTIRILHAAHKEVVAPRSQRSYIYNYNSLTDYSRLNMDYNNTRGRSSTAVPHPRASYTTYLQLLLCPSDPSFISFLLILLFSRPSFILVGLSFTDVKGQQHFRSASFSAASLHFLLLLFHSFFDRFFATFRLAHRAR